MTDGTSSNTLGTLQKSVPAAALSNIMPLKGGLSTKPNQTFQADNIVVVNSKGGNLDRTMQLQDWLSIKENHDLISYGIEGTDWEPAEGNKFKPLNDYAFPGYALAWRPSLERKSMSISASEEKIFDWAQDFDNFTLDPFASFIPDTTPVKLQVAAMANVITQFANPLFYGVVDVDDQLDKLVPDQLLIILTVGSVDPVSGAAVRRYGVKRAESFGGDFEVIASDVPDTEYVDRRPSCEETAIMATSPTSRGFVLFAV